MTVARNDPDLIQISEKQINEYTDGAMTAITELQMVGSLREIMITGCDGLWRFQAEMNMKDWSIGYQLEDHVASFTVSGDYVSPRYPLQAEEIGGSSNEESK